MNVQSVSKRDESQQIEHPMLTIKRLDWGFSWNQNVFKLATVV